MKQTKQNDKATEMAWNDWLYLVLSFILVQFSVKNQALMKPPKSEQADTNGIFDMGHMA